MAGSGRSRGRQPPSPSLPSFIERFNISNLFRQIKTSSSVKPKSGIVADVGLCEDENRAWRKSFEDAYVAVGDFREEFKQSDATDADKKMRLVAEAFFGVYDGHGGRLAVDIIKDVLHQCMSEALARQEYHDDSGREEEWLVEQVLRGGFVKASMCRDCTEGLSTSVDMIVKEEEKRIKNGMIATADPVEAFRLAYAATDLYCKNFGCCSSGATAVTSYIQIDNEGNKFLYTANCGDARAVLVRNKKAIRLSKDHKPTDEEELTRIRRAGGFVQRGRVNHVLGVSRSLGDHSLKSVITSEPYVTKYKLTPADTALVLACDGLWDVVSDEVVVKIVNNERKKKSDAQAIAKKLVRTALTLGTTDNISVIVVKIVDDKGEAKSSAN